jgi:hypothetical protein
MFILLACILNETAGDVNKKASRHRVDKFIPYTLSGNARGSIWILVSESILKEGYRNIEYA